MRYQWNEFILLGLMAFRQANTWNSDNLALDQEHVYTSLGTVELTLRYLMRISQIYMAENRPYRHSKRHHVSEWFPWECIVLLQLPRWHFVCTDKINNSYAHHGRARYTTIAPTNNISDAHHTVVIPKIHHSEKVNSPNNAFLNIFWERAHVTNTHP